jgi:glucose-1-phosphate thymidylyltransferase
VKGIVLAGGLGTRLSPLTRVTNKHLLPVYDKPMIFYPITALVNAGVKEIMVVTGGNNAGDFLKLLANGKDFGLRSLHYGYQEGEGGIAAALAVAEPFAEDDRICVVLGDNIIEGNIAQAMEAYLAQKSGAKIILKKVPDPQRFGVPVFDDAGKIIRVEEKPKSPQSSFAVTGIYMYDPDVFEIIKTLKPSHRGELEITDVNNHYLKRGDLTFDILEGWWSDAGTFESLLKASQLVAQTGANKMKL